MGHPVNCELARSEPKKLGFKRARKTKALTLKFFRLNGPARLTALSTSPLKKFFIYQKFYEDLQLHFSRLLTRMFTIGYKDVHNWNGVSSGATAKVQKN